MCEGCKKVFLIGIVVFWVASLFAQAPDTLWTKIYGGTDDDYGYSVQQTSDGGYIVAGATYSFGPGGSDVWLLKTDADGDTLWTKTYGGIYTESGFSVDKTSDNGYIITGVTYAGSAYDVYLIKTDSLGDTLWTKTFGDGANEDDYGYSVGQTSDNGYIIAGWTESFGVSGRNVYLIKTATNGDALWMKNYGGLFSEEGRSVQQTSDGGYIVAGRTFSFGPGGNDVWLLKTDSLGDTLWTRAYGGTEDDKGFSVQQTLDGGYIIGGETSSFGPGTPTYSNVYIIKTDADGDTIWTKTYGGTFSEIGYSVAQTSDAGYIITGIKSLGTGSYYIYLIKTDSLGNTIWTNIYGGSDDDVGYSVGQTSDNGYIVAGVTYSFGPGLSDVYLIKTGPDLGVEDKESPENVFIDLQVSPNPFHNRVDIKYSISALDGSGGAKGIELKIYDGAGRLIRNFPINQLTNQPFNQIHWDGTDNFGRKLPTGVYFLRFIAVGETGEYKATRKLLVIR